MTRTIIIAAGVVSVGMGSWFQPEGQRPPAGHPSITNPGDSVQEDQESPPAKPEDVASIDTILSAFFESMSGAKGEPRQWERLHSLFWPQARMIATRHFDNDEADAWVLQISDFVEMNRVYMEKGGYFEKEVARRVESFGNLASVWSTYEARKIADSHLPYVRGIYSFQLLKDGERWWIVNAMWDFERPEVAIPEKYLETP